MPRDRVRTDAAERASRGGGPRWGLWLAPVVAVAVWLGLAGQADLGPAGRMVAAVGAAMAVLWLTEAIPVPATALLPIPLLPLLTRGELSVGEVTAPYAHELIFLFLGGFLIALGMQRWGLHRRIALAVILRVGSSPPRLVLGFMLASAFLSMWISNTATVVMMLPIALSVVSLVRQSLERAESADPSRREASAAGASVPFAVCLLLGTAYAASVGGTATLVGTPPNLMMAAFLGDQYGRDIAFGAWLPLGLAFAVVLLPVTWWLLVRVAAPLRVTSIPGGVDHLRRTQRELGAVSMPERLVLMVFAAAATGWILRGPLVGWAPVEGLQPFVGLSDAGIAMAAALLLFVLPAPGHEARALLAWEDARNVPWGILLLFGGGLSLAAAVRDTGVDRFIGTRLSALGALPPLVLVAVVTLVVMLLTEMTSNAATTATFLPILAATAEALGMDPLALAVPATLAASCAFMLPVATPPNAIVFGSGEITVADMARAGVWVNLAAWVWIVTLVTLLGRPLLGIG